MTDCNALRDELKAYLDGELPAPRRVAIRFHLARCADCREEKTAMEQISNELKVGDAGELTATLRSRILEGATPELPDSDKKAISAPWWRQNAMKIWAGAAIAVLAWFIFMPMFSQNKELASPRMKMALGPRSGGDDSEERKEVASGLMPASESQAGMNQPIKQVPGGGSFGSSDGHSAFGRAAGPSMGSSASSPIAGQDYMESAAKTKARAEAVGGGRGAALQHMPAALPAMQRQVVKTADITVEVEKLEEKSDTVEKTVRDSGGFVANNQLSTSDEGTKSSSLSLRVPVDKFDTILASIAKLGDVKAKNVTGEDVTEKVSDDTQSVLTLKNELSSLEAKMKGKTFGPWSLEEQTRRQFKIQIAQAEARLEGVRKLAALATLTVQLREKGKTSIHGGGFLDEMGDTGRSAVNSFLLAARIPVLALIWVLAYAPVWVPLAFGYRYAAKAHRKRVAVKEARDWQSRRSQTAGADASA